MPGPSPLSVETPSEPVVPIEKPEGCNLVSVMDHACPGMHFEVVQHPQVAVYSQPTVASAMVRACIFGEIIRGFIIHDNGGTMWLKLSDGSGYMCVADGELGQLLKPIKPPQPVKALETMMETVEGGTTGMFFQVMIRPSQPVYSDAHSSSDLVRQAAFGEKVRGFLCHDDGGQCWLKCLDEPGGYMEVANKANGVLLKATAPPLAMQRQPVTYDDEPTGTEAPSAAGPTVVPEVVPKAPRENLRVLFLHGYGGSPELIQIPAAKFLTGLKETLPRVDITVPKGFVTIDLNNPVTSAIFAETANNLSKVARYAQVTGAGLHAWCEPKSAGVWSKVGAAPGEKVAPVVDLSEEPVDSATAPAEGVGRETVDEMRAVTTRLLKMIEDDPLGFDVVAGFSQGGDYAVQIAARAHELSCERKPRHYIIVASQLSFVFDRYEAAGTPLSFNHEEFPGVCAYLIAGEKDEAACRNWDVNLERARKAGLRAEGSQWPGGHAMPPDFEACYRKMADHLFLPPATPSSSAASSRAVSRSTSRRPSFSS